MSPCCRAIASINVNASVAQRQTAQKTAIQTIAIVAFLLSLRYCFDMEQKRLISARIDESLLQRLRLLAKRNRRSIAAQLETIIEAAVTDIPDPNDLPPQGPPENDDDDGSGF